MDYTESSMVFHLACQSSNRSWHPEVPELPSLWEPGEAHLPRSTLLNRKRSFSLLLPFLANPDKTLRDRTYTRSGSLSVSATDCA